MSAATSPCQYAKRHFPSGGPLKRHVNKPARGEGARISLLPDHPAMRESRTIFPSTVVDALASPRLLIEGKNQRKIGQMVTKGRWAGMPIYTLTLEERATCPATCLELSTCYGNSMHFARRHRHGLDLEARLIGELVDLAKRHRQGFVVRLHILGDFYSEAYVSLWKQALAELPELRVFGFTARGRETAIGAGIAALNAAYPDRARIRFSGTADEAGTGSLVIADAVSSKHVICPVQTGKADCCSTCGLCWTMRHTVEFIRH